MFAPLHPTRWRHTVVGVLAAWLCVLAVGIWAPIAQAQHSQRHAVHLCSGAPLPPDAPHPLVDAAQTEVWDHVLHCPLCLPVLAPPPLAYLPRPLTQPAETVAVAGVSVCSAPTAVWPPARAPPVKTWMSL